MPAQCRNAGQILRCKIIYQSTLAEKKQTKVIDENWEKFNVHFHLISFLSAVSEVCTEIRGADFMQLGY